MKLLIIRFSSIGDIIMTTPVVRCLKDQIGATIHFLTKSTFTPLLQDNPYIDKIHSFEGDMNQTIAALKNEEYDEIIDLHVNARSTRITKALRLPTKRINKLNPHKFALIYFKVDHLPQRHFAHRALDTIEHLDVKDDDEGMDFFISKNITTKNNFEEEYMCLALGTTHFTKNMPEELMRFIIKESPLPVILLGGPNEKAIGERLKEEFGKKVENGAGKFSLQESGAYAQKAKFVVAGDTGVLHMSCALKKPTISIWGATIPEFGVYPYYGKYDIPHFLHETQLSCRPCSRHGGSKCPKKHFNCMGLQDLDAIKESLLSLSGK